MTSLHLCDNASDGTDRLYKISEFLRLLNKACQDSFRPGKEVCVDESVVPFRGRIVFRQYIPSKRHRYCNKLFKMCTKGGYTYRTIVYAGRQAQKQIATSVAEEAVMALMEGLLDSGRVLLTDNYYTSIPLAETLMMRKTNLIGSVWRNRKGLPSTVVGQKLKKSLHVAQQKQNGVLVLKWRDKRDVLMLSTMNDVSLNASGKPNLIEDYNKGRSFTDISDQMASYTPYVRRSVGAGRSTSSIIKVSHVRSGLHHGYVWSLTSLIYHDPESTTCYCHLFVDGHYGDRVGLPRVRRGRPYMVSSATEENP
ncbi:hypothetical protein Y032_0504g2648 [Ancylostoma ceylanicum]|uniref:PiggyBac transposable element-derived protein domain-containing protein n=1 Tax=Ancylostoma ceylanicum TaxID=53326 RepID=A0A016WV22_9BILA|nr:hypothetical protein Y032_0504g2648 [Ancylostoma ceylanicum]